MKVVGFIPYWLNYKNKDDNNLKKLGGRYLINYSLSLLNRLEFIDDIIIFSSDPRILEYIEDNLEYSFLKRPDYLDQDNISIEDIISEFLKKTDADIIVLLHPNSPFLQRETVSECILNVKSGNYDSAFTAYEYHKFAWFKGEPLNYSLDEPTPKLKNIEPVILEQASLYVFTKEMFMKKSKRIGKHVFIKKINHFEGHDVNEPEDFEIAELIVNSGMYKEV